MHASGLRTWAAALALLPALAPAQAVDEPLAPERAFHVEAAARPALRPGEVAGIVVTYRIEKGYYLYRDKIRFALQPPDLALAAPEFPPALEVDDPFLGKSFIYREGVQVFLPFAMNVARGGTYRLRATAQGCAEDRLCYSPFTQDVVVAIPGPPSPARPKGLPP